MKRYRAFAFMALVTLLLLASCAPTVTPTPVSSDTRGEFQYQVAREGFTTQLSGIPYEIVADNCNGARDSRKTEERSQAYVVELNVEVSNKIAAEVGGNVEVAKVMLRDEIGLALGVKIGSQAQAKSTVEIVTPPGAKTATTVQWKETWVKGNIAIQRPDGSYVGVLPFTVLNSLTLDQQGSRTVNCETGATVPVLETPKVQTTLASTLTILPTPVPPTATPTSTPTPNAMIAFESDRDGNAEIYVMNLDGSKQTRLTYNNADDKVPAWSPDGKFIAFVSDRDGNLEIYVMNADGTNQQRLTYTSAEEGWPTWSPDSRFIAFFSNRDGNREIYVMNADGSKPRRLTNNSTEDKDPEWSPDGKSIAFVCFPDGSAEVNAEICLMDVNQEVLPKAKNGLENAIVKC